ncbi:hypothetical protein [Streptomyces sp. S186]|uniref:hypothetical protein n=1 Tax=Streptomyces sp. S186 TaxID=3434395 RepID=UPI003F674E22
MPLFRKKHETEVYDAGFGNWNFTCSCGVQGRPVRSRQEMETKARLHRDAARR